MKNLSTESNSLKKYKNSSLLIDIKFQLIYALRKNENFIDEVFPEQSFNDTFN